MAKKGTIKIPRINTLIILKEAVVFNMWLKTQTLRASLWVLLFAFIFPANLHAELSQDDKVAIGKEITTLYRSARTVIAQKQKLINDALKGNKGLDADTVIRLTKAQFKKARGSGLIKIDKSTIRGKIQEAMLEAIKSVMIDAQSLINKKDQGFKGFLPAIFAGQVANKFNLLIEGTAYIKLTAPKRYIRNRSNRPDMWEHKILENQFMDQSYEKNKVFVSNALHKGKPAFRLILPEYYKQSCLDCHGTPKGAKDITGWRKEGGKLGELGGAISFVIYD
jgi:hypothetical protein